MKLISRATLFLLTISLTSFAYASSTVYGYVESVTLLPEGFNLTAKLDSGAKTASINATEVKEFTFHDEKWVEFVVTNKDEKKVFKRKLRKYVKIKTRLEETNASASGKHYAERPEVLMKIKLGDKEKVILVDLANRGNFNYPLLLGRDAIKKFDGIVDPSQAFTLRKGQKNGETQGKE